LIYIYWSGVSHLGILIDSALALTPLLASHALSYSPGVFGAYKSKCAQIENAPHVGHKLRHKFCTRQEQEGSPDGGYKGFSPSLPFCSILFSANTRKANKPN